MPGADEFALIQTLFRPLAGETPEARGLADDAALLASGDRWVVTADALVEGVHFRADDPMDKIARKALRVNLSDLAAKGASPGFYLLTLAWPDGRPAEQMANFAAGLATDQAAYGIRLIGGDTVRTPGPLSISITALGRPLGTRVPERSGVRVGDDLWLTGTIGDSGLGLAALRGELSGASEADRAFWIERFHLPAPRVGFAGAIAGWASGSMDVSDGLAADAAKLAKASGVRLSIQADSVPLSPATARLADRVAKRGVALARLFSSGDDYEILFASAPAAARLLTGSAQKAGLRLTRIGRAEAGEGVVFRDETGGELAISGGYVHQLGA